MTDRARARAADGCMRHRRLCGLFLVRRSDRAADVTAAADEVSRQSVRLRSSGDITHGLAVYCPDVTVSDDVEVGIREHLAHRPAYCDLSRLQTNRTDLRADVMRGPV